MTKGLRKRHFQLWMAIGVLLPAGILFSWLVVPGDPLPGASIGPATRLLSVVSARKETSRYCIELRSNERFSKWQLRWVNTLPLTTPTALIYIVETGSLPGETKTLVNGKNCRLVGRIEATGSYQFPVQLMPADRQVHLMLFDFIKERIIDSITLNIPDRKPIL